MEIGAVDSLATNVVIPGSAQEPIEVYIDHVALRMAIVERAGARTIGSDWDVAGVYALLDPTASDGTWGVYVGKALRASDLACRPTSAKKTTGRAPSSSAGTPGTASTRPKSDGWKDACTTSSTPPRTPASTTFAVR
ncbi:hypothetical protein ACFQY7_43050 [Actinomadura luteofluorescens]|uniref:hypothetical protein n=1 Tax=Actinomadura luteofluorescens TaxID=46163 RepID=UPI0036406A7D